MNKLILSLLAILTTSVSIYCEDASVATSSTSKQAKSKVTKGSKVDLQIVTKGNLVKKGHAKALGKSQKDLEKEIAKAVEKAIEGVLQSSAHVELAPVYEEPLELLRKSWVRPVQVEEKDSSGAPKKDASGNIKTKTEMVSISGFDAPGVDTKKVTAAGGNPTYGEARDYTIEAISDTEPLKKGDMFFDLGCGVGRIPAQLFLKTEGSTFMGFDLCQWRVDMARLGLKTLFKNIEAESDMLDPNFVKHLKDPSRKIEYNIADIAKIDWSAHAKKGLLAGNKMVIWICATCFSPELMNNIANTFVKLVNAVVAEGKADSIKDARIVIFTLKEFPENSAFDKYFTREETVNLDMTWSNSVPVYKYVCKLQDALQASK